jgi:hypothetical protein
MAYLEKITKLTGTVALGLQSRADIAAVLSVATHDTCSFFMPSTAADPSTECQMLENGRPDGPVSAAGSKHCYSVLSQAARATYRMTKQILHMKMNGRRPILVSMGINALLVK